MGAVVPFPRREAPQTFEARVRDVFHGVLPEAWPGYAPRDGQLALTRAIAETLDAGGALLAEGPCGTGKSLAYLVPAILRARTTGRPVIIATATIALQEQLIAKDLPELARVLDLPGGALRFAILKGRQNYACRNTFGEPATFALAPEEHAELDAVDAWGRTTETGDRAELPFVVRDTVWSLRSVGTDDCLRDGCNYYESCFARAAKTRAENVDVIVCNMHVLAAHIAVHVEMKQDVVLPRTGPPGTPLAWDTVILDEAHELADIAREFFGCDIAERSVVRVARWAEKHGADKIAEALAREARAFFSDLDTRIPEALPGREPEKVRIREGLDTEALIDALERAKQHAARIIAPLRRLAQDNEATREDRAILRAAENARRRADRLASWFKATACPVKSPDVVLWIEARKGKRGRIATLQGRRVDPGKILADELWGRARTVIATSATLTTSGADPWHWIKRQMGAPAKVRVLSVASPFDFAAQARLVLPAGMPDSRSDRAAFDGAVCDTLASVARGALEHGGVLGLFTSRRVSDAAAAHARANGISPVLAQGEQPRAALVNAMRTGPAVLCGTASLWTGVDLQGDACVALVIDKLPFPPPGDPVMDAIGERLAAVTGDQWACFREELLPRAVLRLRQGVGRLIRTVGDRGIVVICDPRLTSARYGPEVLRALGLPVRLRSVAEGLAWLASGVDVQGRLL